MSFAPRPGCPLCSIVSTPYPSLLQSPRSPFFGETGRNGSGASSQPPPQIVFKDDRITAYLEKANPVSSKGHLVVVLNLHVPSIYMLSSTDLPLLLHIQHTAQDLLTRHVNGTLANSGSLASQATPTSPNPASPGAQTIAFAPDSDPAQKFEIGFIVSPFSDPKIPVSDHVHCHAYVGTMDLAGWWRKVNYSGMGWWSIDDLIAEIREQTSNNRVKSAYPNRHGAPIERVPDAGARVGLPNGVEIPQPGLDGDSPASPSVRSPHRIPSLNVTDETDPITPRVSSAGEEAQSLVEDGGPGTSSSPVPRSASQTQLKRPMGPRTKGTDNSIPLSQVSSGSPSPEPTPAS